MCKINEYWLGLENIFHLSRTNKRLVIELELNGEQTATVEYEFIMAGENQKYSIKKLENILDNQKIGTAFRKHGHREKRFSTPDSDNDRNSQITCAKNSGWWYNKCFNRGHGPARYRKTVDLNGPYDSLRWDTWSKTPGSITATKMMLGPLP